jgi:predicted HicB family RNase H-like nuclease
MNYLGYTARIEIDEDDGVLVGTVEGIRDVVTFQAATVEDLDREFRVSVDEYIAFCREQGDEPEKPYSGSFPVRTTPALHREAVGAARREGISLNAWVSRAIQHEVTRADPPGSHSVTVRKRSTTRRSKRRSNAS